MLEGLLWPCLEDLAILRIRNCTQISLPLVRNGEVIFAIGVAVTTGAVSDVGDGVFPEGPVDRVVPDA